MKSKPDLEFSEFPDNRLVQKESDVLLVVQGLHLTHISLLCPLPVPGLSWKHSFQNTQPPEILNKILTD